MGLLDKLLGRSASSADMSNRQLQRELNRSVARNDCRSIAERASMLREGERRGITANQDKKK